MDTLDELKKIARDADRVDKDRAESLRILMRLPVWAVYVSILDAKIQELGDNILAPVSSVDGCIVAEGVKGTMRGLLLARNLPEQIIEQMKPQQVSDGDSE